MTTSPNTNEEFRVLAQAEVARSWHTQYVAYIDAGFTAGQAFDLTQTMLGAVSSASEWIARLDKTFTGIFRVCGVSEEMMATLLEHLRGQDGEQ